MLMFKFYITTILCFFIIGLLPANVRCEQNPSPEIELVGEVVKKSELPDPATAAYPDCLTFLKFKIVKGEFETSEALVAMWGFKAYKLSEPGSFDVGDKVKLKLVPFSQVEKDLSEIMRVDDTEDYDSKIYWAKSWEIQDRKTIKGSKDKILPPAENKIKEGKKVEKILRILKAHEGEVIGGPDSKMLFGDYSYLTKNDFWKKPSDYEHVRAISILDGIVEFSEYLKSKNIHLVLVIPPSPVAIYPDVAVNVDYNYKIDGRIDLEFLKFKEELQKNGVFCIDILPEFMEHKWITGPDNNVYPLYIQDDPHWSDMAASMVGKSVAMSINSSEWFRSISKQFQPQEVKYKEVLKISTRAKGDYSKIFPEWNYQPSKYIYREIIPENESLFILKNNDPAAPIWILGDSFSNIPSFHHDIAATLGIPCYLNSIPGGSRTAVRESFARIKDTSNIKVVVWEIAYNLLPHLSRWKKVNFSNVKDIFLTDNLLRAKFDPKKITVSKMTFYSVSRNSFVVTEGNSPDVKNTSSSITWDKVHLGKTPIFSTNIAVETSESEGVEFQVLVNDKVFASQKLTDHQGKNEPWRFSWDIDLAEFSGEIITLELRVTPDSSWNGKRVCWGDPLISDAEIL